MNFISVILINKNGGKYISEALNSLLKQDEEFELIIQDCCSRDNSLEIIESLFPEASVVSEMDTGVSDAMNRAIIRCKGDIITTVDSDNLMPEGSLSFVKAFFQENSDVDVMYGDVDLFGEREEDNFFWQAPEFDQFKVLTHHTVVPWAASAFNLKRLQGAFKFDERLKTCGDFQFWLSILDKNIVKVDHTLSQTRLSEASMSVRPDSYEQFCEDKILAFLSFVEMNGYPLNSEEVRNLFLTNLYSWSYYNTRDNAIISQKFSKKATFFHKNLLSDQAADLVIGSGVATYRDVMFSNALWKSEVATQSSHLVNRRQKFTFLGSEWLEISSLNISNIRSLRPQPKLISFSLTSNVNKLYLTIYTGEKGDYENHEILQNNESETTVHIRFMDFDEKLEIYLRIASPTKTPKNVEIFDIKLLA
ncbi:glycosyltransferase [Gammaproteobacteria bacterium]|nr:glycosyltransferase [Gammaproteobacteria bacterium]